jgi:putative endonuclease
MNTRAIGDRGEDLAAEHLNAKDYTIMDRNYRFERNEVDLVCFDPHARGGRGEIVFVEVKTRSGLVFDAAEPTVDEEQQTTIVNVAKAYLYERQLEGSPTRFDVIRVVLQQGNPPDITHFEDAFVGG